MKIFVLTGAGGSAESGLEAFRDRDGVWTRYDLEDEKRYGPACEDVPAWVDAVSGEYR